MKYDLIEKTNKPDFKRGDDDTVTKYFLLGEILSTTHQLSVQRFCKKSFFFCQQIFAANTRYDVQQQSASTVGI